MADIIEVKIGRLNSEVKTITLSSDDCTISKALQVAGMNKKDSEIVKVNNEEEDDLDSELENGDLVVLVKNVEGGFYA